MDKIAIFGIPLPVIILIIIVIIAFVLVRMIRKRRRARAEALVASENSQPGVDEDDIEKLLDSSESSRYRASEYRGPEIKDWKEMKFPEIT